MKSQRRHELKQNVLDSELGKIADFFRRRGNTIAWIAMIVLLGGLVGWYVYIQHQKKANQVQQMYAHALAMERDPRGAEEALQRFKELADQDQVKYVAADSCVRAGDLYALSVLTARDAGAARSAAENAAVYYRKAISDFPKEYLAVAKAHYGLGKLAETNRDFVAARKEYQEVLNVKQSSGYPVAQQAEAALASLEYLATPAPLATTSSAPSTEPSTAASSAAPVITPATQPANAPAKAAATKPAKNKKTGK